jgi:hypothetical protein
MIVDLGESQPRLDVYLVHINFKLVCGQIINLLNEPLISFKSKTPLGSMVLVNVSRIVVFRTNKYGGKCNFLG